jgi:hypothetical protein
MAGIFSEGFHYGMVVGMHLGWYTRFYLFLLPSKVGGNILSEPNQPFLPPDAVAMHHDTETSQGHVPKERLKPNKPDHIGTPNNQVKPYMVWLYSSRTQLFIPQAPTPPPAVPSAPALRGTGCSHRYS